MTTRSIDQADSDPIELHLARCACGFVVSGRTQVAIYAAMYCHLGAVPLFACDAHWLVGNVSSPDPVAAKLLLGAHR